MRKYYFYATFTGPQWYTMTTDVLRDHIDKSRNEEGIFQNPFAVAFIFMGKCTEAKDKDEAEDNFRSKNNLTDCKEPACMTRARREYFEQRFLMV